MKKTFLILAAMMLSTFNTSATSNSKEPIGLDSLVENYTAISDSVIQRMDVITTKVDSLHAQMKSDAEKDWLWWDIDASNMWVAFLGLAVGIIGTWYGYRGFKESKRTADNVMRASLNVLEGQFNDLIRHLYRNLVCTLAFSQKTLESVPNGAEEDKKKISQYPSEEHLLKLKILSEDALRLEKYNNDPDIYQKMHELKLLFRNYDVEIDTTLMHLKNRNMKLSEVKNDLDTLVYKPLHLINKIREITDEMKKSIGKEDQNANTNFDASENAALIMTREHVSKLNDWEKKKAPFGKYIDLARMVPPFIKETEREENESPISKPYDGLRRSRNLFYDKAAISLLKKQDIFGSDKFDGYSRQIKKICKEVEGQVAIQDKILDSVFSSYSILCTPLRLDIRKRVFRKNFDTPSVLI